MTFSDALPIQFWLSDCQTYNEYEACGVHHKCWCHPWECDDEINIQFTDAQDLNFQVQIIDENQNVLFEDDFIQTQISEDLYVYDMTIDLAAISPDICSQKVQILIVSGGSLLIDDGGSDVTGWTNQQDSDPQWLISPFTAKSTYYVNSTVSPTISNGTDISVTIDINAGNADKHLYAILSQSAGSSRQTIDFGSSLTLGNNIQSITTDDDYDQIELYVETPITANDMELNSVTISSSTEVSLSNPSFESTLSPWSNVDTGGSDWSHNAGLDSAQNTVIGPDGFSDNLVQTLSSSVANGTHVEIDITYTGSTGNLYLEAGLGGAGITPPFSELVTLDGTDKVVNFSGDITSGTGTTIALSLSANGTNATINVKDVTLRTGTNYAITNGDFSSSGTWTNVGTGYPWSISGGTGNLYNLPHNYAFIVHFFGNDISSQVSKPLSISSRSKVDYDFSFLAITDEVDTIGLTLTIQFKNAGNIVREIFYSIDDEDLHNESGSFTTTNNIDEIVVFSENTGLVQDIELSFLSLQISASAIEAKSDCLDIQLSQKCSVLINYSNSRNFSNLIYENGSPDISFNIRVPAIFFHERPVREQEIFQLTNQIISLNSSSKTQQLLETNFMPYYMHRKMQLILQHSNITINNTEWVAEEEYELIEGNKKFPMRRAQTYLTKKDSLSRNVL